MIERRCGVAALALIALLMLPGLADYYRARIHPIDEHRLGVFDKVDLILRAEKLGIPFAPIQKPVDLLDDPHLNQSGGFAEGEFDPTGAGEASAVRWVAPLPVLKRPVEVRS